jgi:hypothetical protein
MRFDDLPQHLPPIGFCHAAKCLPPCRHSAGNMPDNVQVASGNVTITIDDLADDRMDFHGLPLSIEQLALPQCEQNTGRSVNRGRRESN